MIGFMLSSIRSRIGNVAGALVAVTIAIVLLAATTSLIFAASNADLETERFAATDVIVQMKPDRDLDLEEEEGDSEERGWVLYQTPPRLPASLAEEIAALPGVAAAIPDVQFEVNLLGPDGDLLSGTDGSVIYGHIWDAAMLSPFTLREGTPPVAPDEIVIDAGLSQQGGFAVGDSITVLSSQMPATYRISGITSETLTRQGSVFFSRETVDLLADAAGMADRIAVIANPGVEPSALAREIEAHLDDPALRMLTGSKMAQADPTSDAEMLEAAVAVLGTMSSFSGFVAIFVMASTFTFSILQRQREIGLQRAIGATPRQIRRMVGAEALVIGLIGTAIGLPVGLLLANVLARMLVRLDLAPAGFGAEYSFWPLLIAAGSGIIITQISVFGAARRAARIRPIEAMRESAAPRRLLGAGRLIMGLVFVLGGLVLVAAAPAVEGDARIAMSFGVVASLLTGAALLGPLIVLPFAWIGGRLLGRFLGAPGDLAAWNGRGAPNRIASVASPLMLAVGFACMMFFLTATLQTITIDQSKSRTTAELVVLSGGVGLPLDLLPEIQAVDGVASASGVLGTTAAMDRHQGDVLELDEQIAGGVDPATLADVANLDVSSGSLDRLQGETMALSRLNAEMFKADIGDVYEFHLDDGTIVPVEVVAIYDNFMGFEEMLFPVELAARMARIPAWSQVYVALEDGASGEDVAARIAGLHPELVTLQVLERDEYIAMIDQSMVEGAMAIYLIIGVSVFFAGVAVINTMAMSTSERSREFAQLRMIGATRTQVRNMVLGEAGMVTVIGATVGIGIGLLSMIPVSLALAGDAGSISIPFLPTVAIILAAAVIAVIAHLLPARFVLRSSPLENMGIRE